MPTPLRYVARDGTTTWRVRFRRHGRSTSETFHTKAAARTFCRWIDEHGTDEAVRMRESDLDESNAHTLDEVAAEFFVWKEGRVRSDRTVKDYRRDYRRWIAPRFGERKITLIGPGDVQRWVDDMLDGFEGRRPAAPKSIGDRHALLHAMYAYALSPARQLATENPCLGTDLPRKVKRPPKGLHPGEWRALAPELRRIDEDAADLADFLLASGWRFSEGAAVPVWAVEDYGDQMHIPVVQVIRRNAAGEHAIVPDTKNVGSNRRTLLDEHTAAMVRRRCVGKRPSDLVFTTGISAQNGLGGSTWHYSNFRRRYWDPAVRAAGLSRQPTPHWLRHTAVYWLVLAGASLAEISKRIGHRQISTTIDVYGQMVSDVSAEALSGFVALRDGPLTVTGTAVTAQIAAVPHGDD